MRPLLDGLRFTTELCAVAALAVAGASASSTLGASAPITFIVVWGTFVAPKSNRRLPDPARLSLEIALFAAVGAALIASQHAGAGLTLATTSTGAAVALRTTRRAPSVRTQRVTTPLGARRASTAADAFDRDLLEDVR